jgi:hypothetical protein
LYSVGALVLTVLFLFRGYLYIAFLALRRRSNKMGLTKRAAWCAVSVLVAGLWVLPVCAGWLDSTTAYQDATSYEWKGTNYFRLPTIASDVDGYAEWAVYGPGSFPFPATDGYDPPDDQYTYVFQFHNTGTAAISQLAAQFVSTGFSDLSTIGYFTDSALTGDEPLSTGALVSTGAFWDFDGVVAAGTSCGLVYSSPYPPVMYKGYIVNHGKYQNAYLPSPSSTAIPEPATLWLFVSAICGSCLGLRRVRRRPR